MKFKHVNPRNVAHLIPHWAFDPMQLARTLDDQLDQYWATYRKPRWDSPLGFSVEVAVNAGGATMRIAHSESDGNSISNKGQLVIDCDEWAICVPINDMLKECPDCEGLHCVYVHQFPVGLVSQYFGITKQRWFDRLAQHESSARNGSPYLFHRSLRERAKEKITHRVFLVGVSYEQAMKSEEEYVDMAGLYPRGLNMIPGGLAGLRYLHKLGIEARSAKERDEALESLSSKDRISGYANPLCAARWSTDQIYINRVICGHSGRLTVEQVRMIRIMDGAGKSAEQIAAHILDTPRRVRRVLKDKVYARVA